MSVMLVVLEPSQYLYDVATKLEKFDTFISLNLIFAMVGTRNNYQEVFSLDQDPSNVPPAVRKIQSGGSGSR